MSDLPYHIVVGMPALSPTMETGTIASWNVSEGDEFAAGDSLAEIETDKATIDFEAQDDGVVAKILKEAGSSDIAVGVPIMVTVEEKDDVSAFSNFVVDDSDVSEASSEPVSIEKEEPEIVEVKTPEIPVPTPAVVQTLPEPQVVPPVPEVVHTPDEVPVASVTTVGPAWGNLAKLKSPLANTLTADHKKFIEMYGSSGQVPL